MPAKSTAISSMKRMTIEVPVDLHRQYKHMAVARGTTIREMITEAMREQVSRQKPQ